MSLIELHNVTKIYKVGEIETYALREVNLNIEDGQVVVVLGPSGSGKSTLLNVLSGLDKVTSGEITYEGQFISNYSDNQLTHFRRDTIGFIFQAYHLLPNLTVYKNIEVGSNLSKDKVDIDAILKSVEMYEERNKFPYQLSGGQQQRVSIARALAKNPKVLFCDEPTGALDEDMGKKVLSILQNVNKEFGTTILIITHNPAISALGNQIIHMNSGRIAKEKSNQIILKAEDIKWAK